MNFPHETHRFPLFPMEMSVKRHIKLNSVPNLLGGVQLNKMEEIKWKTF